MTSNAVIDIGLGRLELAGLEADRDLAVDARLGQIDAAVIVDGVHQPQIVLVGLAARRAPDAGT